MLFWMTFYTSSCFFNYVENVNKIFGHNKMFYHCRSRLTSNEENFSKTSLTRTNQGSKTIGSFLKNTYDFQILATLELTR